MTIHGLITSAALSLGLLLAACGGGSGRGGTDVAVSGVAPSGEVRSGDTARFMMTVANVGDNAATDVQIVNLVGNQLALSGIGCTAAGGAVCPDPASVSMTIPTLPAGGSLTFDVNARVTAAVNGTIVNTMSATYADDVDRTNNSATVAGTAYSVDVGVSATAPVGPLFGGTQATFTMVVDNTGPGTALDVEITNTLGENLSAAGAIGCVAGGGAVCPAATGPTMVAPSIPAAGTLTFSVPVTVNAGTNGLVSNTMTIVAGGDSTPGDNTDTAAVNAVSSDLGVSQAGEPQIAAGETAVFTALVANAGSATSDLVITHTLSGVAGTDATISCTASAGATCPATLGPVMNVPALAAGRVLSFTFSVAVPADARGDIVSAIGVTAVGDPDPTNNQASVTTAAVDARNGSYLVFAADGREYDLTIDFDAGNYTMIGDGATVERNFTADGTGLEFVVSGTSRFRVATDLVVGGHDFGDGVLPYVAAREFATSINQLGGLFNLMTRNITDSGVAVTRPATSRVSGNVWQVCQSDSEVSAPQSCAGTLRSYELSVSGEVFSGVEVTTGEPYSFRLARTGGSTVLLSAGTMSDGSRELRIGLEDASGLAGGVHRGSTTTGDWVTITIDTGYAVSGVLGGNDSAPLLFPATDSAAAPFAMQTGPRASDNQTIFVMQALPLTVVFGDLNATGTARGLLQVALP